MPTVKTTRKALALPWRARTEQPTELPVTALIAVRDALDPREIFLLDGGVYEMRRSRPGIWVRENTDTPLRESEFWWLAEDELFRSKGKV